MHARTAQLSIAALVLLAGAALVTAGPLNPPAGPVASSMKTLTEVEPRTAINAANTPGDANCIYKITQRGSYYLTGNITGIAGKYAIQISADNITLDMSGLCITGGAHGILVQSTAPATRSNITIRNGAISGSSSLGIDARSADGCVIQNITTQACAAGGIYCGPQGRVEHCTADHCGNTGITGYDGARISDCQAQYNALGGIEVRNGGTVENCTASNNTFRGINTWNEVTVRNCAASHNTAEGIYTGSDCVVGTCTVAYNGLDGIYCNFDARITGCMVSHNGGNGIVAFFATVADCDTASNGGGDTTKAGIRTGGGWSGAGRVESNTVTGESNGILCEGRTIVVRNFGHSCTTFIQSTPTDTVGPIISATGTIATINPWANFSN
jgi:parallel beta-helix repeat protein